jgi:hypothetical protein
MSKDAKEWFADLEHSMDQPTTSQVPTQPVPTEEAPEPVPAPEQEPAPAPQPEPRPTQIPERDTEDLKASGGGGGGIAGGKTGLILALGGGLIVVNTFFGDNAASLVKNLWTPPSKQTQTPPISGIFPVIGEVIFLVVLVTISRFGKGAENGVLAFLVALWMLWAIFRFPDVYKSGIAGNLGALFGGQQPAASSTSTTPAPAVGQPYALKLAPQPTQSIGSPANLGTKTQSGGDYIKYPAWSM